jgi:hypothetical protein
LIESHFEFLLASVLFALLGCKSIWVGLERDGDDHGNHSYRWEVTDPGLYGLDKRSQEIPRKI